MEKNNEVIKILNNYSVLRTQQLTGVLDDNMSDKIAYITDCIEALVPEDKCLIRSFYVSPVSRDKIARQLHLTRRTMYRKRDRIVKQLSEIYSLKFKQ